MSNQGQQQQQQPQQPGPPGIGMGRGASNSGLQNSVLPLSNNISNHPGALSSQQSLPDDEEYDRLLNSYIYEHLLKSGFYKAARGLYTEASLQLSGSQREDSSPNHDSDNHLPRRGTNLKRSHSGLDNHPNASPNDKPNGKSPRSGSDSPHNEPSDLPPANVLVKGLGQTGFLRAWWAVFWDVYSARSNIGTPSTWAHAYLDIQVVHTFIEYY